METKTQIINLLETSIIFSSTEKENIINNYEKLPSEFISELLKILQEEKQDKEKIEQDFTNNVHQDMEKLKTKIGLLGGSKNPDYQKFFTNMEQEYINAAQGKTNPIQSESQKKLSTNK